MLVKNEEMRLQKQYKSLEHLPLERLTERTRKFADLNKRFSTILQIKLTNSTDFRKMKELKISLQDFMTVELSPDSVVTCMSFPKFW